MLFSAGYSVAVPVIRNVVALEALGTTTTIGSATEGDAASAQAGAPAAEPPPESISAQGASPEVEEEWLRLKASVSEAIEAEKAAAAARELDRNRDIESGLRNIAACVVSLLVVVLAALMAAKE